MTGTETLWPSVLLALVLLLVGLAVFALGIVVPRALAVAKAAFVGSAARAILGRLAPEEPDPPGDAPAPAGASPRRRRESRTHELPPPNRQKEGSRDHEAEA